MCGFIGVLSPDKNHHANFKSAANTIAVRGSAPLAMRQTDHESYGYARLPTDDISNKQLARISQESSFLLFNGIITNVTELCTLFHLAPQCRDSDHYCLTQGYSHYGASFLARCRGMFACAFVTDSAVTLIRDTIGIKPLYYVHVGSLFAFASEMKALQHLSQTIYEVPIGGIVTFVKTNNTISVRKFHYQNTSIKQSLDVLLHDSLVVPTRRYLQQTPQKQVALLLSGGVDSSVLAAKLVKHLSKKELQRLVAFSLGNSSSTDMKVATKLAKQLGITHVKVPLPTDASILAELEQVVYRVESPHARVAKVALLYAQLAKAIKKHEIDIVIGGEGADELFFGYHRFITQLTHRQSDYLFGSFFKDIFPHTLLQRFDRIFAGHQIEGRVPFLDQAIIEYAEQLPPATKIHHTETGHISKLPLRQLAAQLDLPPYVSEREKEKMTAGVTGRPNSTDSLGYLEQATYDLFDTSFQDLVSHYYATHFPNITHRDSLSTEEALAQEATLFKKINAIKQRRIYVRK